MFHVKHYYYFKARTTPCATAKA